MKKEEDSPPEKEEMAANDNKWSIPRRWEDIAGLGKEAAILLATIVEGRPSGDISPRYLHAIPPRWSVSRLYREVLRDKMPHHADLQLALTELHEKDILHLAYTYYVRVPNDRQLVGLFKHPPAMRAAFKRKYPTSEFDESNVEIYLVLPEDTGVDHSVGEEPSGSQVLNGPTT